jgi:hypothetical protein
MKTVVKVEDRYEGTYKQDGKNFDEGVLTRANGIVFNGKFDNRYISRSYQLHFKGIVTYLNGDTFKGNTRCDLRHDSGTLRCKDGSSYAGKWLANQRHGKGRQTTVEGDTYSGNFQHDKLHGEGRLVRTNGAVYEGQWVHYQKHGQGTMTWTSGDKYIGEYQHDCRCGQGSLTYANGDSYEGQWRADVFEGRGLFRYASGDSYEGQFLRGCYSGLGFFRWASGRSYLGEWIEDLEHGFGVLRDADGAVEFEGTWDEGDQFESFAVDGSLVKEVKGVDSADSLLREALDLLLDSQVMTAVPVVTEVGSMDEPLKSPLSTEREALSDFVWDLDDLFDALGCDGDIAV